MATAQEHVPRPSVHHDSTNSSYAKRLLNVASTQAQKNITRFKAEKLALQQDRVFEDIKKNVLQTREFLRRKIDTVAIRRELAHIENCEAIAGEGVLTNRASHQTYRNLATTARIFNGLLIRLSERQKLLDARRSTLVHFRYQLDSLSSDTALFIFPADSLKGSHYLQKMQHASQEIDPVSLALQHAILQVQGLQAEVNLKIAALDANLETVNAYQQELSAKTFDRDLENLWDAGDDDKPFREMAWLSWQKAKLALYFYCEVNWGKLVLVLLALIVVTVYLSRLRNILKEEKMFHPDVAGQLVLRYPFLSALLLVPTLSQFFFTDPPFVFSMLFWTVSAVSLTVVYRKFVAHHWEIMWLVTLAFFFFCCLDNLVLQGSSGERWVMLIFAIIAVVVGILSLLFGPKDRLHEKWILYFIGFVILLECLSVPANLWGRYNLAKNLLTSGYFGIVIAMLFLWTMRFINEGLGLSFNVYTKQERQLFNINFERVGTKAPPLLYALLIVGWFILVGRNFYVFRQLSDPFKEFLITPRTVGDYSFSISSILIFLLIMILAAVVSRIVSFFASDRPMVMGNGVIRIESGIGSWLLLVRIFIFSMGLFLAFAASDIPTDRLTIILGALGVGIGFGLQTLVNNLVSGLIIAFEKPVNVGDIIEFSGQVGTMKSIGFRSSRISTMDGADVIMPNGDLLTAHLVNWTLSDPRRRLDITLGVAFGTDLSKTEEILNSILQADKRVLLFPAPVVLFQGFGDSSVNVKVFFWVSHFKDGMPVKSDIIKAIDTAFRSNAIVIPFPQQDVYVRTVLPLSDNEKKPDVL